MFAPTCNYSKLKTNLRLCINRLKLIEKKKTELALRSRKEIADYIANGKIERAKIRVEFIVREDYIVEAMEIVEMYCDLLLARFGMIQQMKTLDEGLSESVSSVIWAAPRLQTDITELKVVSDMLTTKYGKLYAQSVLDNSLQTVNEKLRYKLGVSAPPKHLVEQYMVEIAKSHNVRYDVDPELLKPPEVGMEANETLIDLVELPAIVSMPQPMIPQVVMVHPYPMDPMFPFYQAPQYPPYFPADVSSLPDYEKAVNFPPPYSNSNTAATAPSDCSNEKKALDEDDELEQLNKRFEALKKLR